MYASVKTAHAERAVRHLIDYIRAKSSPVLESYIRIPDGRTARILSYYPGTEGIIRRELHACLTEPVPDYCATVWLWNEPGYPDFASRVLGLDLVPEAEDRWIELFHQGEDQARTPLASIDLTGTWGIHLHFGTDYFYGLDGLGPRTWFREGHLFVQALFRICNNPGTALVHGACIGSEGGGVLMCARGGGGKSTLSVLSMLRGFDYVSDDYLFLQQDRDGLYASPLYSFVTLSPQMYEFMYDDLDRARLLGVSPWGGKYVLDISGYGERFRSHYPVRVLLFPEITPDAASPAVLPCTREEKGKTLVQIAHSTLSQMGMKSFQGRQRDSEFLRKVLGMLGGLDCYRITLSPDLEANVSCLRTFIHSIQS